MRGGAIVTWFDSRSGNWDIFAQRVNASGVIQWTTDGVPLCTAIGSQEDPQITSDGASGAIVTWEDYRSGSSDIFAQRVNGLGVVQWADRWRSPLHSNGRSVVSHDDLRRWRRTIVTWYDYRSGLRTVYAQRVNASGGILWASDGVPLCNVPASQYDPRSPPMAGGAIVTWLDYEAVTIASMHSG